MRPGGVTSEDRKIRWLRMWLGSWRHPATAHLLLPGCQRQLPAAHADCFECCAAGDALQDMRQQCTWQIKHGCSSVPA